MSKIYLTCSIPYVNGKPHIGWALEVCQADALKRLFVSFGHDVVLETGADENAMKNVESAEAAGLPVQDFIDRNAAEFERLLKTLNIDVDLFCRTSHTPHKTGAQAFWKRCEKDIYKKSYTGLYCVGCEAFYKDGEFEGNICPHHNRPLEEVTEENYFFKLSSYAPKVRELLLNNKIKIYPEFRKQEILNFIDTCIKEKADLSVSRPASRVKNWGVPVPNDETHRMYVWFDALTNYVTSLGFGNESKGIEKNTPDSVIPSERSDEGSRQMITYADFWENSDYRIHCVGKDINKFHSFYWPAMLLAAGLPLPTHIFVHGFITSGGQKMSKTLGNVIDPFAQVETWGVDPVRYYLLREIPTVDDGDYSESRMKELYESDLANELGNLVSRACAIAAKDEMNINSLSTKDEQKNYADITNCFQISAQLEEIWQEVKALNKSFNIFEPWKKSKEERAEFMVGIFTELQRFAKRLKIYLPATSEKIVVSTQNTIIKIPPIFPKNS